MGGAPRNLAPRNHFLVRIVKPSGCHCTDAFGGNKYRRVPTPPGSTSPFSDSRMALHAEGPGAGRLGAHGLPSDDDDDDDDDDDSF